MCQQNNISWNFNVITILEHWMVIGKMKRNALSVKSCSVLFMRRNYYEDIFKTKKQHKRKWIKTFLNDLRLF